MSAEGAKFDWIALLGRDALDAANCPKLSKLERSWKLTAALIGDVFDPFGCFSEFLTAMAGYARKL